MYAAPTPSSISTIKITIERRTFGPLHNAKRYRRILASRSTHSGFFVLFRQSPHVPRSLEESPQHPGWKAERQHPFSPVLSGWARKLQASEELRSPHRWIGTVRQRQSEIQISWWIL